MSLGTFTVPDPEWRITIKAKVDDGTGVAWLHAKQDAALTVAAMTPTLVDKWKRLCARFGEIKMYAGRRGVEVVDGFGTGEADGTNTYRTEGGLVQPVAAFRHIGDACFELREDLVARMQANGGVLDIIGERFSTEKPETRVAAVRINGSHVQMERAPWIRFSAVRVAKVDSVSATRELLAMVDVGGGSTGGAVPAAAGDDGDGAAFF